MNIQSSKIFLQGSKSVLHSLKKKYHLTHMVLTLNFYFLVASPIMILDDDDDDEILLIPTFSPYAKNETSKTHYPAEENEFNGDECPTANLALLNILLSNPEELEYKYKPSGIRRNFFCTLNSEKIPVSSALVDDNGAYSAAGGKARYLFYVTFKGDGLVDTTKTVRYDENGSLYYNTRVTGKRGKTEYVKTYVDDGSVYELTRIYRKNKANPELVHMIVTVRKKNKKDSEKTHPQCKPRVKQTL